MTTIRELSKTKTEQRNSAILDMLVKGCRAKVIAQKMHMSTANIYVILHRLKHVRCGKM